VGNSDKAVSADVQLQRVPPPPPANGQTAKPLARRLAPQPITLKDGKEIGRVVEYGKYGEIDKELGEIVSSIQ